MPMLPIIDLLIFCGWSMLTIGAVLKAVYVTTHYRPTLLTMTPMDFLVVACMFLLFALTQPRSGAEARPPRVAAAAVAGGLAACLLLAVTHRSFLVHRTTLERAEVWVEPEQAWVEPVVES